jgi:hypothetical protein
MTSANPGNFCRGCGQDFSSLAAFDRHHADDDRVTPTRWNPRPQRCLGPVELEAAGLELDDRGQWRFVVTEAERDRLAGPRAVAR